MSAPDLVPLTIPDPEIDDVPDAGAPVQEERGWESQHYEDLSNARHSVVMRIHAAAAYLIPAAVILAALAVAALVVTYVLNIVLPTNRRWLTPEDSRVVHDLLFSSIAGAAITSMGKAYFSPKDK
jgi:Mn2+/Fe2+ NRAMP family transporter